MNPIDVAWLLLKNPQQPTITDFMRYTRPQLEQMLVMFQNELIRRGHDAMMGEVNVPNQDNYMTGDSMQQPRTVQDLMTQLMSGQTLSTAELLHLQDPDNNPMPDAEPVEEPLEEIIEEMPPDAPRGLAALAPNAVRARLLDMGVPANYIEDEHISQYQDFLRTMGRHPTEDEVNAHIG